MNTLLIGRIGKSPMLKPLFDNFRIGNVRFEDMDVKNIFYEIVKTIAT